MLLSASIIAFISGLVAYVYELQVCIKYVGIVALTHLNYIENQGNVLGCHR